LELLQEYGLTACKPASTPVDPFVKLYAEEGMLLEDPTGFRRLIGRLLYLTNTRPDISFAVQHLSQFVPAPRQPHLQVALRIIRFLKASPGLGLFYPADSSIKLQAFSDSDWASCPNSRRSITGYCVFLGKSLISWKSKKQTTVSRSSFEAEYRSLASVTCELQWLQFLCRDLHIPIPTPFSTFCDSQSAIQIAKNPHFHERTKHIEVDCHVIRSKIHEGLIKLFHIPSHCQLADMFTKALFPAPFRDSVSKLGLINIHDPT
jgi:hypothetical protein